MFQTLIDSVSSVFHALPFTGATWFVIAIIAFVVWMFSKAHRDSNSTVRWEDLIIDPQLNKVSPYKLGYLIGMIVSTWLIISLSDRNSLDFDIFGLYLSYLLGGAGWSEFVNKRKFQNFQTYGPEYEKQEQLNNKIDPPQN